MKTFVGLSENALHIHNLNSLDRRAEVAAPLSKANWSLYNLASMLRLNLFTYRDLAKWLHDQMETLPLVPVAKQLTLALL